MPNPLIDALDNTDEPSTHADSSSPEAEGPWGADERASRSDRQADTSRPHEDQLTGAEDEDGDETHDKAGKEASDKDKDKDKDRNQDRAKQDRAKEAAKDEDGERSPDLLDVLDLLDPALSPLG